MAQIAAFGRLVPLPTGLLYGGITEELLLRRGLMTLLLWAAWRLLQRRDGGPKAAYVVGAIVISSLVLGVGHLPVAYMILPEATAALTLYVIVANSVFGLIAGYLYWKRGRESAVLAHMLAHVVMLTASKFGPIISPALVAALLNHMGDATSGCRNRPGRLVNRMGSRRRR